jgi:hypothetical protein
LVEQTRSFLDVSRLVSLDESSINTGMTRLYGRALKNERIKGYVPDVRFQRISVLSSIGLDRAQVPLVFNGTLNGELFKEYISRSLAASLSKDDILIMDNSSVHKSKIVIKELKKAV